MKISEALTAARKLLIENTWIKYTFAEDENGVECDFLSDKAKRFCAVGALKRACGKDALAYRRSAHVLKSQIHDLRSISSWNDDHDRKKEEVLQMYDYAIEEAQNHEA